MPRSLFKMLTKITAVLALVYACCALLIVAAGLQDDVTRSDVAIVPGSKVMPNGSPSLRLAARLDAARALYADHTVASIIVSGGTGPEGFSESAVMRGYLLAHGVPAAAILTDADGVTTWATARNSAAIMRARGYASAIVVSQYFHVPRTRLALEAQGVRRVSAKHARYFELRDIYSALREVPALASYWLRSQRQSR